MRVRVVLCVIFLALGVTIVHATATTGHTCAPAIPPVVPNATLPAQTPGIVVINEVLRTPGAKSAWECMDTVNTFSVNLWIELYNPQDQPFDLYAVRSSLDSGPQTSAFSLPFGAAIAPHGFLVIFPNTFLAAQGTTEVATLRLLMYDTVIDQINVPPLATDTSYARIPDGSAAWSTTAYPTINASNALSPVLLSTPTPTPRSAGAKKTPGAGSQKNTTGHSSTPGSTRTGNTGKAGGDAKQQATATREIQPTWNAEHFSDQANASITGPGSVPASSTTALATAPPINAGLDLTTKILLTLAAILLTFTIIWIWRLFCKRDSS